MNDFLEALVVLLPFEAGGRPRPIAPREGNYRPCLNARDGSMNIRFIEGPPELAPGHGARIIAAVEPPSEPGAVVAGEELEIVEGTNIVGILTVMRVLTSS
jgi:hypothetical protein